MPVDEGGTCDLMQSGECYASFQMFVSVPPTTWTDIELPWSEFEQPTWSELNQLPGYPFERELLSFQITGSLHPLTLEIDKVELY